MSRSPIPRSAFAPVRSFVGRCLDRAEALVTSRSTLPLILAVCLGPIALGWLLRSPVHQLLTAIGTAIIVVGCLNGDRWKRAIGSVAAIFLLHSAIVVAMTVADAGRAATMLPGSDDYWASIRRWVVEGIDDEYRLGSWAPTHLLLALVVPVSGYTSFGILPFTFGFEQIDLMNYYVGRLIPMSQSPVTAIVFGWHPWSLLRGAAYTVLVFEAASLAAQHLSGRPLAPWHMRGQRFLLGMGLAIADALVKLAISPWIQRHLHDNLLPGTT